MNFSREKGRDIYLLDTRIDNLFIGEYMPMASGDCLKAYIYAQMCAEHGLDISDELMASQLGVSIDKIAQAWEFWESVGVLRRRRGADGEYRVELLNLREQFYHEPAQDENGKGEDGKGDTVDEDIRRMYQDVEADLGRSLSSSELREIAEWISEIGASPHVISAAVKYSLSRKKDNIRYIGKIVRSWTEKGLTTEEDVEEYLSDTDDRYGRYRTVIKMLGLSRNPTEFEMNMMDVWFDEYGLSMEKVREACSRTTGISNPNFNYINKIIRNWKERADETGMDVNAHTTVTTSVLNRFYDYLREKKAEEARERLEEVYEKIPEIKKIDDEMSSIGIRLSKAIIRKESGEDTGELRQKMDTLQANRAYLLAENDFDIDYTEIRYACPKCNDTGINETGGRCECIQKRIREAEIWQKENGIRN